MALTLWLSPGASDEVRYSKLIEDLASRFDAAVFSPHITLLSRLPDNIDAVRKFVGRIVAEVGCGVFDVPIRGVSTSDDYYRCVVVELELSDELRTLRSAAESITVIRPGDEYRPHLSLVYGRLSTSERMPVSEEIGATLPKSVRIEWLDVVRTERAVEGWRREDRIRLETKGQ